MSCFPFCSSQEKLNRKALHKSMQEYEDTKTLASFSKFSFESVLWIHQLFLCDGAYEIWICQSADSNKQSYSVEDVNRLGKGNISAQLFSLREVCAATENFNPENLLGEGGFGRVYKGHIKRTDQVVAVKQLDTNGFQGNREFLVEVLMLSLLHHPNLVNLVGYSAHGDQRILVYEYMPNGSLEDHLFDLSPNQMSLDWLTRMRIALGAAKGLEYLHDIANPPVIYRDFKASNILLDAEMNPKLSDFGLAKLGPTGDKSHVSTRVMGTFGYCAPEYVVTGRLSTKSDVYNFGVVLLEMITGRRVIDMSREPEEQNLLIWARPLFKDRTRFTLMADPLFKGSYPIRGFYQALAVAAMCLLEDACTRPVISDVVTALDFLAMNGRSGATTEFNSSSTSYRQSDNVSEVDC